MRGARTVGVDARVGVENVRHEARVLGELRHRRRCLAVRGERRTLLGAVVRLLTAPELDPPRQLAHALREASGRVLFVTGGTIHLGHIRQANVMRAGVL